MQYFYITGTSTGLGKVISEKLLLHNNFFVFGISRHQTLFHKNYKHLHVDLSDAKQIDNFQFQNHIDASKICLINNAGSIGEIKYTGSLSYENIQSTYQLDLITPHQLINQFLLKYQNYEAEKIVINISSGAAQAAYDGWSVYCGSKAGLDHLSVCVAKEQALLNSNTRIFSIAPGVMQTNMQEIIRNTDETAFSKKNKFVDLHLENKLYDPSLVAEKYMEFILNPKQFQETIYRIQL